MLLSRCYHVVISTSRKNCTALLWYNQCSVQHYLPAPANQKDFLLSNKNLNLLMKNILVENVSTDCVDIWQTWKVSLLCCSDWEPGMSKQMKTTLMDWLPSCGLTWLDSLCLTHRYPRSWGWWSPASPCPAAPASCCCTPASWKASRSSPSGIWRKE